MKDVLLVEDESSIADNVRVALAKEGYALTHAKTADEGERFVRQKNFVALILDVGLPDRSGFDLCKRVRGFSQVPILFLTARAEEVDKIVGFELGADDYITKPFSPRELAIRIRAITKRVEDRQTPNRLSYGRFEVDIDKQKITFDGKILNLSRYEFRILETLIRRPGVVFSRTQIMELAWDDPDMSLERTVDTHIKAIRAKLAEASPDETLVQTHRGSGYSLKEIE